VITWLGTDLNWLIVLLGVAGATAITGLVLVLALEGPSKGEARQFEKELDREDPTATMPALRQDDLVRPDPDKDAGLAPLPPPLPRPAGRHTLDLPGRYDSDVPAPAGQHHPAEHEGLPEPIRVWDPGTGTLMDVFPSLLESASWEADFTLWASETWDMLHGAWDWYYAQDRPWAQMTSQFAAVRPMTRTDTGDGDHAGSYSVKAD
jgi:hypothetical protein